MGRRSLILLLLWAAATFAYASDRDAPARPSRVRATAEHFGDSPFSPVDPDDTRFILDDAFDLDTGCTFRSGSPLLIRLEVGRYVGLLKSDGTLLNPSQMIASGLISPTAHLRMPVYDVDVKGDPDDPTVAPERDRVFFNGHDLGLLTGDNEIWKLNEFDIPIEWVKFPLPGPAGFSPLPAENVLEIRIDQSNTEDVWCTSVDWVELEFFAVAPVFLVHGTAADSSTWDPHFTNFFRNSGAPFSNNINLEGNGTILHNGVLLSGAVERLATAFGAKKCHLIAHSKGGLDSRAYLDTYYDPKKLRVLSLYTISTPHHGTILSDIILMKRTSMNPQSSNADLEYLISHDPVIFTPRDPALGQQTTGAMAAFNMAHPSVPANVLFYNYGADADANDNGAIDTAEIAEFFNPLVPGKVTIANVMYRTIGSVASISVVTESHLWGLRKFTNIEVASTPASFRLNDLVVSDESAHAPTGIYLGPILNGNHSSIKSEALASSILDRILANFPNR